jgi:hypothetical protein
MIIKVAPLGERVSEISVATNTTVQEALRIAHVELNGRTITVNDSDATLSTPLTQDGSIIALVNKMKGGR